MKLTKSSLFTLFIAQLTLSPITLSWSAEEIPNPGPRSPQEAKFLFDQAQDEIAKNDIKAAIRNLERLIERYPRDPEYARAHELLITLYLANKDAKAAAKSSKAFLLVDAHSENAQKIRSRLIEAYYVMGKNTEARATAKELLAQSKTDSTRARALYLLARVDTKEKKWNDARAKLDALPAPIAAADRDSLLLEIGVSECMAAKAPSKKVIRDDPWIDFFEKQNFCFKALAAGQGEKAAFTAYPLWCDGFQKLQKNLTASRINPFQKSRLQDEFKKTADLAQPMECGK